jgi:hypothetical protein
MGQSYHQTVSTPGEHKSNCVETDRPRVIVGDVDEVMTESTQHQLEPFYSLEINALARELEADGRDICFLEQGASPRLLRRRR